MTASQKKALREVENRMPETPNLEEGPQGAQTWHPMPATVK